MRLQAMLRVSDLRNHSWFARREGSTHELRLRHLRTPVSGLCSPARQCPRVAEAGSQRAECNQSLGRRPDWTATCAVAADPVRPGASELARYEGQLNAAQREPDRAQLTPRRVWRVARVFLSMFHVKRLGALRTEGPCIRGLPHRAGVAAGWSVLKAIRDWSSMRWLIVDPHGLGHRCV